MDTQMSIPRAHMNRPLNVSPSDEGPWHETLDFLFHILVVHQPFYILQ